MITRFHAPSLTECFLCGNIVDIGDPVVFDATWPKGRRVMHEHCFDNWPERLHLLPDTNDKPPNLPKRYIPRNKR